MMSLLTLLSLLLVLPADTVTIKERIDLYAPSTGAFLGAEQTWYDVEGRRLRLEITDAEGTPTLVFFIQHDAQGRESEALYIEGGGQDADREVFTYSADGRTQTTTYYYEPGVAADRTESVRDEAGREVFKRYYRADGTQYGEEEVFWNPDGTKRGWDFRYVEREGGTSFRYTYDAFDDAGAWLRRTRSRNGNPERLEVRTQVVVSTSAPQPTPVPFALGSISTDQAETSPSFAHDGKTMVFARYGDDWTRKDPFIAYHEEAGWRIEPLADIGPVYNLALSPDGQTVFYATRIDEERTLYRIRRDGSGWSDPENLTARYGLVGTYPSLTEDGTLVIYDAEGVAGAGVYAAKPQGTGFSKAEPLYVPNAGGSFDGYVTQGMRTLLVSRCFDETCASGPETYNGIWEVALDEGRVQRARKLPNLPYAWGVQPVEALGLFVFTDGEDILAVPLSAAGLGSTAVTF